MSVRFMYSIISWLYLHYRWSATHTHWQIKLKKHHANINTDTSWSGIPSSYSPATQCEQKWSTNSDVAFVQESSVISFTLHWISSFLISRFFFDTWRYNSSSVSLYAQYQSYDRKNWSLLRRNEHEQLTVISISKAFNNHETSLELARWTIEV